MKKRKVIGFFVLLLMFAALLSVIQITKFGSLAGFVTINQNAGELEGGVVNYKIVGVSLFVFIFIFILGGVIKFLRSHHERAYVNNNENRRKLIQLEIR